MHITVVGSGYAGLVAGACFADLGHEVILVDNDQQKVAALSTEVLNRTTKNALAQTPRVKRRAS
jgi:UDP-glucose 6-dehydrogenase